MYVDSTSSKREVLSMAIDENVSFLSMNLLFEKCIYYPHFEQGKKYCCGIIVSFFFL